MLENVTSWNPAQKHSKAPLFQRALIKLLNWFQSNLVSVDHWKLIDQKASGFLKKGTTGAVWKVICPEESEYTSYTVLSENCISSNICPSV